MVIAGRDGMKAKTHADYFPPEKRRDIVTGPEHPPVWHVLLVPWNKMLATREYLKHRGIFAFFPSEEKTFHIQGKAIVREIPLVTGQVYAQFRQQANWDVMQARRLILGVYAINGRPVVIPPDSIRHLQGMTVAAERMRQARAEFLRINVGDSAKITQGPWTGHTIEVSGIRGGEAWFDNLCGGIKGSVKLDYLEKSATSSN